MQRCRESTRHKSALHSLQATSSSRYSLHAVTLKLVHGGVLML